MSITDPGERDGLTGVATMEALLAILGAALERRTPEGPRVGLICIDVGGMAAVNRVLGLGVGDAVLLGVADRLREGLRGKDPVGRWGGGFAVCLGQVLPASAIATAERLRREIAANPVPTPAGAVPIIASLGLAIATAEEGVAQLFQRARLAVTAAKAAGGDRVILAD
jgi:diguanylate cyclase (GGDEF)-like protein